MKIVMVTGASSGIGAEFVRQLDNSLSRVDEIWMIARSREKLEAIAAGVQNKTRILALDLEQSSCRRELQELLKLEAPEVCMLVNAAGFGAMGGVAELETEEQLAMIELNCKALTAVTCMTIPYIIRNGRIIQMASAAAFMPQADFAVYAATKSYVLSFSRALQEELLPMEIYVTAVCPGPVDTPFFERAERNGSTLALKKNFSVTPKAVVRDALNDSKRRKTVSVCSLPIKLFHVVCKIMPHNWLLEIAQSLDKGE